MSLKGIKVNGTAYTIDYDELDNKPSVDAAPAENSDNLVKSGGVYAALADKQDSLTFDSAPTENSTNPVTSGGIKNALDNISGGSSPDWDQSDSSASDYIKNRPMYKNYTHSEQILSEEAVSEVSSQTAKVIYNSRYGGSRSFSYYKSLLSGTPLVSGRHYRVTVTRSGSGTGYDTADFRVLCCSMKKTNSSGIEIPFIHCSSKYGNSQNNYYYLNYSYALMLWYDPDDDAIYIGGSSASYFSNYTYTITLREDEYDGLQTLSGDLLPDPDASKYAPEFADDSYASYSANAYSGYVLVNTGVYYRIPLSEAVRSIILWLATFEDEITNYDFVGDAATLPGIVYNIIEMLKTHGTSISTLQSENATLKSRVQKLKNQIASVVEQLNEQGIDVSISESIELEDGYLVTDAELEDGWLALDSAEITDGYITTD